MSVAHPGVVGLPAKTEPKAAAERKSWVRSVLGTAGWVALVALVTTLSAFVHLATSVGRAAATDIAAAITTSRVRGTARIGAITRLDFDGVAMEDISVTSPGGERVVSADRMTAEFAFIESFRRGAIVLTPCELEGGEMRITRGPSDQIDLVYALEVPDDLFMIPVEIRDIRLLHQTMIFSLPGIPVAVEMSNVYGLVDMQLGHEFAARMDRVNGFVNIPIVHIGFDRLEGRIRSDDPTPLVVRMALDLEVADPTMEIRYSAPGAVGRDGGGHLGVQLGADVPDDDRHIGERRAMPSHDDE